MSPLHINILLHYYTRPTDYAAHVFSSEPEHANSGAVAEFIEFFVSEGLLSCRYGDVPWAIRQSVNNRSDGAMFKITDKGIAMVEALCAVQIPVCRWVQPERSR